MECFPFRPSFKDFFPKILMLWKTNLTLKYIGIFPKNFSFF